MNKILNIKNPANLKGKVQWEVIQTEMKNKLGQDIYDSWLKKIFFEEEHTNYILLSVSTRFIRDWITSRYLDQILQIIRLYNKEIIRIEFIVKANKSSIDKGLNNFDLNQKQSINKVSFIND